MIIITLSYSVISQICLVFYFIMNIELPLSSHAIPVALGEFRSSRFVLQPMSPKTLDISSIHWIWCQSRLSRLFWEIEALPVCYLETWMTRKTSQRIVFVPLYCWEDVVRTSILLGDAEDIAEDVVWVRVLLEDAENIPSEKVGAFTLLCQRKPRHMDH